MVTKSVNTIVEDVRVCLDEIGANEAEFVGGTDSDEMNAVIESKIADAIRYVYLNADLALFTPNIDEGTINSDDNGVVEVKLAEDFLRLCSAKLEDWDFPVTEAITPADKRYAALKNPITTGYPDNPKAAIEDSDVGKYLYLYSSSKKGKAVNWYYLYIKNDYKYDDSYIIYDNLYRAVVYQTAGLTLQAFKDAHAESMFNMALTMMK